MLGFKLFTLHKDGSIGPLFINKKLRLEINSWYTAEDHPTKGYAHRPGWHVCARPIAPHLTTKGRVWGKVDIEDYVMYARPIRQGGIWYLAQKMKVLERYDGENHWEDLDRLGISPGEVVRGCSSLC
jgi:hypothetical protein